MEPTEYLLRFPDFVSKKLRHVSLTCSNKFRKFRCAQIAGSARGSNSSTALIPRGVLRYSSRISAFYSLERRRLKHYLV